MIPKFRIHGDGAELVPYTVPELFFFAAILWIPGYYIVTNYRIKQETEQIKASSSYRPC